ncbi:PTS sugar transporter subunit IIA [Photobacterium japonica]|uniref:PTS sugar transporter subunit IIA n=1 Tax=Photobacterium japonica TaxID=2910235 RepID=UPI003D100A68
MIVRRITFLIGHDGLPAWALNRLKVLGGYFCSMVVMRNVSQRKMADVSSPMRVMALGTRPADLCQLLIEGADAELAAIVLTDFIAEHGLLVQGGRRHVPSSQVAHALALPFACQWHAVPFSTVPESGVTLEKRVLLSVMADCVAAREVASNTTLLEQLLAREAVSSTCMGNGIALPHVISPAVTCPHVVCMTLTQPLDWGSNRGPVTRIIGLVLPHPPQRPHLMAFSAFSQALLDPAFCDILVDNDQPDVLDAIIKHTLATPFRDSFS